MEEIKDKAFRTETVRVAVAASLLPVSGELNVQMCSLTSVLSLFHFR